MWSCNTGHQAYNLKYICRLHTSILPCFIVLTSILLLWSKWRNVNNLQTHNKSIWYQKLHSAEGGHYRLLYIQCCSGSSFSELLVPKPKANAHERRSASRSRTEEPEPFLDVWMCDRESWLWLWRSIAKCTLHLLLTTLAIGLLATEASP